METIQILTIKPHQYMYIFNIDSICLGDIPNSISFICSLMSWNIFTPKSVVSNCISAYAIWKIDTLNLRLAI